MNRSRDGDLCKESFESISEDRGERGAIWRVEEGAIWRVE